jgi:hypothetical protein
MRERDRRKREKEPICLLAVASAASVLATVSDELETASWQSVGITSRSFFFRELFLALFVADTRIMRRQDAELKIMRPQVQSYCRCRAASPGSKRILVGGPRSSIWVQLLVEKHPIVPTLALPKRISLSGTILRRSKISNASTYRPRSTRRSRCS